MVQRDLSSEADSVPTGPIRMCIGCRQRSETRELIRIVAVNGDAGPTIAVDQAKTMPGRGAWLHPRSDCLSAAVRRKAPASALRVPGLTVDPHDLAEAFGGITGRDDPRPGQEQVAEDMSTS